ncbi:MAG: HAMP domain-containing histidine kinase [Synergistaceae bacterium]|jgi:signal transduction histidine kinase|nr:HAMP domain-containing histidine kinase [Synergistaceae bacterium]
MKKVRRVPVLLFSIFVLAVLVPSIALGFLALRAAERESLYVERHLEETLLTEADLAVRGVEELMNDIAARLERDANSGVLSSNPLADVSFALRDGRLVLSGRAQENFTASFGAFLRGGARLPVYDSVARVYRKEMQEPQLEKTFEKSRAPSATVGIGENFRAAEAPPASPMPMPDMPETESVESENYEGANENAVRKAAAAKNSMPRVPSRGKGLPDGTGRQLAENRIAVDSAAREEAFLQASQEGFEISQRNVVSQARQSPAGARDERSRTVSRSRDFAELSSGSSGGLLPRLSDEGLEVLFWTKRSSGVMDASVAGLEIVGCTLRMDALRERIVDVLPAVLSEVRVLAALDDRGTPLVTPEFPAAPDWRRPFVAREISPLLPRWEVGIWLVNPADLTSRARFAALVVWVLVASLFLLIGLGSLAVLWMLSSEMRVAAQKTTFVTNVSHELKTPLTSIRLFAELLLSGRQGDERKRREYLRTMMSEVDRLTRLIDNVLALSKRGKANYSHSMQALSLTELARETAAQLEPHLMKNGFAIAVEDDGPLPVLGNREALRQVVMNLLSNAEKYSGDVREIRVRCETETNVNGSGGEMAVLEVADRGIGVEPRFADRIFREFFRVDDSLSTSRSGAGLGLSIARDIARRHGGDVLYAPRPNGGSLFTLRLPIREDKK